jgi:hypothetical protein
MPASPGEAATQPTSRSSDPSEANLKAPSLPANPAYLDRVAILVILCFSPINYIKKHGHPPFNEDNVLMRLLYHVPGFCSPTCTRVSEHRAHTAKETTQLVTPSVLNCLQQSGFLNSYCRESLLNLNQSLR